MEDHEYQHHDRGASAELAGSGAGPRDGRRGWVGVLLALAGFVGFWALLAWVLISSAGPA